MRTSLPERTETGIRAKGVQDDEAGFLTKLIYWRARRLYGHVPLSTRIRAIDTKLLRLAERMNKHTREHGAVLPKLKEFVQLKVAAMVGCPF